MLECCLAQQVGIVGVSHTIISKRAYWCWGVVARVIRRNALRICVWQMFLGCEVRERGRRGSDP